ncbi:complex I subunit 5 family protein [Gilvimarinus sp. F26214L]|uniref:complex I subunit 5 family protein n=1 Tax=Gilvimarinus sp. DZF01 TaxID=3461371 RepID=UPI00404600C5
MNYALLSLSLPFAAALLLGLLQGLRPLPRAAGLLVLIATVLSLGAAALALQSTTGGEARQLLTLGGWPSTLAIRLLLTPLKALILVFFALVHLLVGLYALCCRPPLAEAYWPLSAFLHAALVALILSADLFNVYVALEFLSLAAVALVGLSGPRAYTPALIYLLLSLGASLCYLMGVAILYGRYGVLDMFVLSDSIRDESSTRIALLLMTAGLMLKGALWPLHMWLPQAHTHAPTPVSALLSGLVVKGPLFVLWELWSNVAPAELGRDIGLLFALGGAIALVVGGWSAWRAPFIKMLVAYSTVAQLGYAMMGLGLLLFLRDGRYNVALWLFVLAHGLAKVSMFLAAGDLQESLGSRRVTALRGATQTSPLSMTAFAVAGTSLIGLPPTGGFLAKWVLLEPMFTEPRHWPWAFGVFLGTFVSAAYVFRAVGLGFSRAPGSRRIRHTDRSAQWFALLPALLVWAMALIGEDLIRWLSGVTL